MSGVKTHRKTTEGIVSYAGRFRQGLLLRRPQVRDGVDGYQSRMQLAIAAPIPTHTLPTPYPP